MKDTETMARELCACDLRHVVEDARIPELVQRYWPVLANEIRQGVTDGEWPYSAEEIDALTAEYRTVLGQS